MSTIPGVDAYPLAWPDGWPRTAPGNREEGKYRFRRSGRSNPFWTFVDARNALLNEVRAFGGASFVLSSNFKPNRSDLIVEPSRRPDDQGVAIYFLFKGKPKSIARDCFLRFEENCRSITLALEAMRALERHGGGVMLDRAFEGFTALPAPTDAQRAHSQWEILGVASNASKADIEAAYRAKAMECHPDKGGTAAQMIELNAARSLAIGAIDSAKG